MFTGIVKLAQIDDYINPSQNCIQPKIMKQAQKPEKATVSLNDCLACSGCITSAQSVLIQQMSIQKLIQQFKDNAQKDIVVIIAPQSILSIANSLKRRPDDIFSVVSIFFKKHFGVKWVLDVWQGTQLCHQLIYQQYMSKEEKTLLCSQCPGWICYAQKTLTESVVKLMSKIKSPQQVLARCIKDLSKESMVVTVMPCYDKKLQAIRFEIDQNIKEVDITITTNQLLDLVKTVALQQFRQLKSDQNFQIDRFFKNTQGVPYSFLEDQTSNGYLQYLIKRLNGRQIKKQEIRNSDFVEYQFISDKNQTIKMAKCYGFRNIQKVVQLIKKDKCEYAYIQIMACPGGCYNGGGQIKIENVKPKEQLATFNNIAAQYNLKHDLSKVEKDENFKQNIGFSAKYKVIQKSLTQSVMNW